MTDDRKAAREHGILDERILDRRRFLARLGAGAAGAAFLGLADAGGLASAIARPLMSGAPSAGATPIYMVALGDSVMWGQGLADAQKFQTKIANWIQTTHPDRRPVQRWNFAHSGATIGGLRGMSASHTTGQMTAAVFARTGSGPRRRDFEDVADFEPRRLRDSTPAAPVAIPPGRPIEPADGDLLGGEIPRTYPTLWRQLDIALETLRTGRDRRTAKGLQLAPVDPAAVHLVLLNGGANDVDFLGTIVNRERNEEETYRYVRGIVEPRMKAFLPEVLGAFPNATFVMPTYYQGISDRSTAAALSGLVQVVAAIIGGGGGESFLQTHIPGLIARNRALQRGILESYRAALAANPDAANRIHVVVPGFSPLNAYGAPQSYLFHLEETDPAEPLRRVECQRLFEKWMGDMFASGQSSSRVDTPIKVLCDEASSFHPNVAGANHYFVKIRDTLAAASPAFMRGAPRLRVVVNGTTTGDTKTVTVTAFDAQSNQPVNAAVSIGGVSGRTGAPLSYKASACAVESGAATETSDAPGPVRRPVAGRVVRPATAKPVVPCAGKVVAPGYVEANIRY